MITSTPGCRSSQAMARAISRGAASPCTWHGAIRMATGARRWATRMMSRTAAPVGEVATPIRRGRKGSGRLRSGAKRPSASSLRLSCSKASCSAPSPLGSM